MRPAIERLLERIELDERGCWVWTAYVNPDGYAVLSPDPGHSQLAHRFSYVWHVGPVQPGMELDHVCRNRACVNPDHLEQVTHRENMKRSITRWRHQQVAQCPQGHDYSPQNTGISIQAGGHPNRYCKACRRDRSRARRAA